MTSLDKVISNTTSLEADLKKNAPIAREITHEQWLKEGRYRFGPDMGDWKFICPSCNHVASVRDYMMAGQAKGMENVQEVDGYVGYSCIGRLLGGVDAKTFQKSGGPCMYSGGGLIRLNPVRVVIPKTYEYPHGRIRDVFEWAPVIAF